MIWIVLRKFWPVIAAAIVLAAFGWLIYDYGKTEYQRGIVTGRAEIQQAWDKAEAERIKLTRQHAEADAKAAQAASTTYQQEQAHDKAQTRIVRETVTQYVDRPVFRDRDCVDDGLRDQLNSAISGSQASAAAR